MLPIMDPKEALSPQRQMKFIAKLAVHFPNLVKEEELDKLQEQWQDLLYARASLDKLSKSTTSFWHELNEVKDVINHAKFDKILRFMCDLLSLPHSSASVERMFSQLNMIKTKCTNRLLTSSVANRLLEKQAIARQEVPCYDWEPSR